MDKHYQHQLFEAKIYQRWQQAGSFRPSEGLSKQTFTIIMPPPNANDPLHIGHAMFVALEDTLIRYHRLTGKATLWLPGADHAGIETQFVFEKKLKKEGKSRFNFDRNNLYQMIWDYVQANSGVAQEQMKRLGASADWSRFKFTLEPGVVTQVLNTFVKLHQHKLVFRDLKLVNYCTSCGTAFSELEVDHNDQNTNLYYIKYRLVGQKDESVIVATTRPEPIFADTHLAVHPKHKPTQHLIGKKVENPMTGLEMEILADEFVDPEFGTGIVKLTPAHDHNDFEVAKKHNLPIIQAINPLGKIVDAAPENLRGLKVEPARTEAVRMLTELGLIDHIDTNYQNRTANCYRCGRVLEPLPLPQFFVKVKPLTQPVLKKIEAGELKIYGSGHDKILKHWLTNLKDWNITRQIVWGIRLPVWYKLSTKQNEPNFGIQVSFVDKNNETVRGVVGELIANYSLEEIKGGLQNLSAPFDATYVVSIDSPGEDYLQETDTFDTWFSSAQWPVVALKDNHPGDFERFYPTQVMETGHDILPFWVMRMLMMGQFLTDQLPFSTIYLHGLIRDQKGQKMSKSKGNVINPVEVVDKYGADALRLALTIRSSAGLDKNVGESDIRAMRNFTNKIWNATRFVLGFTGQEVGETDAQVLQKITDIKTELTDHLENFRLGLAADFIYNQFWHYYCDEVLEAAKRGSVGSKLLRWALVQLLILLHPFAPFVTEACWQQLKPKSGLLISTSWNQDIKN